MERNAVTTPNSPHHPKQTYSQATATSLMVNPSTNVTDAQHCPAQSYAMNLTPSTGNLQKTSLTPYDSHETPVKHHEQTEAPDNMSICIPNHDKQSANDIDPDRVTFWTSCTNCRTLYEYLGIFLNKNLRCQSCKMPFVAIEMPAPNADVRNARCLNLHASRDSKSVLAPSKENAQSSSRAQCHERRHKKEVNVTGLTGAIPVKRGHVDSQKAKADEGIHVTAGRSSGSKRSSGSLAGNSGGQRGVSTKTDLPRRIKELSCADMRIMLSGKAITNIFLELDKWKGVE